MFSAEFMNKRRLLNIKFFKKLLPSIIMLLLIGIDQFTKFLSVTYLKGIDEVSVLGEVLVLKYCENTGAAFSMFQDNKFILVGLTSLFLLIGLFAVFSGKIKNHFLIYTISAVVAGGIGNLIDRISLGYVVDFIYIKIIDFAIFNFADMCITLGGIAMVVYILFFDKEKKNAED